jgi:LacI family transcriptional regulator
VPLVLATRALDGVDVDTVLVDDVYGAFEATATLLREGHRRIAFLGNRLSVFTGRRRFTGFRRAHERAGVEVIDDLVRMGQQDVESAQQAMAELLEMAAPPTAVFSANNRNTVGAIRAIAAAQRQQATRRPDGPPSPEVRLYGFDSFEFADLSPIPLSVVDHDAVELGRCAARMLFERLDGDDAQLPPRLVELPVSFRAPAPASA